MESKNVFFGCLLVLVFSLARCDIAKDREKCANQLVGIATCLPYVSGEAKAKAPPSDCCSGFKKVFKDSRECICILIKDRDDPSLGLKINATLALSLPAKCNAPINESITDCPRILHLPPNSPDAKVFEDFAKDANKSNTTTTAAPAGSSSSGTTSASATSDQKSDGGERTIWYGAQMVAGLFIAMVQVHIFIKI